MSFDQIARHTSEDKFARVQIGIIRRSASSKHSSPAVPVNVNILDGALCLQLKISPALRQSQSLHLLASRPRVTSLTRLAQLVHQFFFGFIVQSLLFKSLMDLRLRDRSVRTAEDSACPESKRTEW